jgi:hypothetical protein
MLTLEISGLPFQTKMKQLKYQMRLPGQRRLWNFLPIQQDIRDTSPRHPVSVNLCQNNIATYFIRKRSLCLAQASHIFESFYRQVKLLRCLSQLQM